MAKVNLCIEKSKPLKNGKFMVQMRFSQNQDKVKVSTGIDSDIYIVEMKLLQC